MALQAEDMEMADTEALEALADRPIPDIRMKRQFAGRRQPIMCKAVIIRRQ